MKTKTHSFRSSDNPLKDFDERELQATMRDFLAEEEKEKSSIWNIATVTGVIMIVISVFYILQLLGLISGLEGWMDALPIVGFILIGFVGFGYFVGDRKRVKRLIKKQRQKRKKYFDEEFGGFSSNKDFSFEKEFAKSDKQTNNKYAFGSSDFDSYALDQSKKLYKSRSDKKIAGVCGGLSKYFGISASVIRFLFIITIFASVGAPIIIYVALAIALDKEPIELVAADDFNT